MQSETDRETWETLNEKLLNDASGMNFRYEGYWENVKELNSVDSLGGIVDVCCVKLDWFQPSKD
jgi:hypothetical protein